MARELKPWRNLILQIWNEHSDGNLPELIKAIRQEDPKRIITNSPGFGGVLGTFQENRLLDFLSPHTYRDGKHWDIAAAELAYLLARFRKPVVDDEPARTGLRKWGGPAGTTIPVGHILHIANVGKAGAYAIYHHDMFQSGAGSPEVPPSGIPDPEFSPYHKLVFDCVVLKTRATRAGNGANGSLPARYPALRRRRSLLDFRRGVLCDLRPFGFGSGAACWPRGLAPESRECHCEAGN